MTRDERRKQQLREASRRYRERHPEYREREKQRMQSINAARDREDERQRIAEYRMTHPVQTYLTGLKRRRRVAQRKDTE